MRTRRTQAATDRATSVECSGALDVRPRLMSGTHAAPPQPFNSSSLPRTQER
jgi:hypothetical protein